MATGGLFWLMAERRILHAISTAKGFNLGSSYTPNHNPVFFVGLSLFFFSVSCMLAYMLPTKEQLDAESVYNKQMDEVRNIEAKEAEIKEKIKALKKENKILRADLGDEYLYACDLEDGIANFAKSSTKATA
jgi:hypothetical protein